MSNKYLSANKDYITELGLKKSSAWLIPTHSIIYSNGATIGAISINKYPVCTKQGILGIVPNTNIDVEFLYYSVSYTHLDVYKRQVLHRAGSHEEIQSHTGFCLWYSAVPRNQT